MFCPARAIPPPLTREVAGVLVPPWWWWWWGWTWGQRSMEMSGLKVCLNRSQPLSFDLRRGRHHRSDDPPDDAQEESKEEAFARSPLAASNSSPDNATDDTPQD